MSRSGASLLPPQLTNKWRTKYVLLIVILTAAQTAPAAIRTEQWLGWAPAAAATYLLGTTWSSLIAGIVAAWMTGSLKRLGMQDQIKASSRGIDQVLVSILLSIVAAVVVANLFSYAIIISATALYNDGSLILPITLLLVPFISVTASSAWAAFGALIAYYFRAEVALPVVVCAAYGSYVVPVLYLFETPLIGVLPYDGRPWIYASPSPAQLIVRYLTWVGLAMLLTALLLRRKRFAEWVAWPSIGLASLAIFLGGGLTDIPGAREPVCRTGETTVCMDLAHAAALDDYEKVVSTGLSVLPERLRPAVVSSVAQGDEESSAASATLDAEAPGVLGAGPIFRNTEPSMVVDSEASLVFLGDAMFNSCGTASNAEAYSQASLTAWWRLRHGIALEAPIVPGSAPWIGIPELEPAVDGAREVSALSGAAQESWLDDEAAPLTECWRSE